VSERGRELHRSQQNKFNVKLLGFERRQVYKAVNHSVYKILPTGWRTVYFSASMHINLYEGRRRREKKRL
jgi:hypothetical protein